MVTLSIILALAFGWLLFETNWLRIRLPMGLCFKIGDCSSWRLPDEAVNHDMKSELLSKWTLTKIQRALFEQDNLSPLCGWGFAYQYRDFEPEYKIELIAEHSKYTIKSNNMQALRDCFRVYRNPYLKVKL